MTELSEPIWIAHRSGANSGTRGHLLSDDPERGLCGTRWLLPLTESGSLPQCCECRAIFNRPLRLARAVERQAAKAAQLRQAQEDKARYLALEVERRMLVAERQAERAARRAARARIEARRAIYQQRRAAARALTEANSACSAWEQVTIADEGPNLGRCGLVNSSSVTSGAWSDPNKNGETP